VFLTAFCVALGVSAWDFVASRQAGNKKLVTRIYMRNLSLIIKKVHEDNGVPHPVGFSEMILLLEQYWGAELESRQPCDLTAKTFLDAWGEPIVIQYNDPAEYVMISFGLNRKDDNRKGDDIVRMFKIDTME
jgi:hypothetical protein